MTSPIDLRDLLLSYLLGEMEPPERKEVDTRLIADPEFAAEFEDAQNDLLDEHAAGTLTPEDLIRVHHAIARNPAFARAAQMAAALRVATRRFPPTTESRARPGRPAFRIPAWAVAACGLLIAGGIVAAAGWRFRSSAPAKSAVAQSTVATPSMPAAAPLPAPASALAPATPAEPTHRASAVLEATLIMPETSRSTEATMLEIAKGIQRVRVQWPISADIAADQPLTLTVLQSANQVAQIAEARPRRTISGAQVANFALPASSLQPGTYLFRVTPANANTAGEPPLVEIEVEVKRS